MNVRSTAAATLIAAFSLLHSVQSPAQAQGDQPEQERGFRRGPGGPGGPGAGPMGPERELVKQFDRDGDKRLDAAERAAARESIKSTGAERRRPRFGPGGPGGPEGGDEPVSPGERLDPGDVEVYPDSPLFDTGVLRTIFLRFESDDWEAELADFYNSDVEVPAEMIVDGVTYPGVGVHFRGASSYFTVDAGHKRSLNLSLDFMDKEQRLYGERTLNLLNSHSDPTMMSTVLFSQIARAHIPAPRANYVRVVINGESWGVYVSAQQFNSDFVAQNFKTSKGARWKVKGSPRAAAGLDFQGDDLAAYKQRYEMKSGGEEDWAALIELCRVLDQTPPDRLVAALKPMLDIEGALWFLALDNALINNDGYWVRASDYNIYRDPKGVFHVIPHDMNEAFAGAMRGRGGAGGPGGGPPRGPREANGPDGPPPGAERREGRAGRAADYSLDPLVGMDDARTPLRSRLLAVPALRERYLDHVRTIARDQLDWKSLGPVVAGIRRVIDAGVKADTRKLTSFEQYDRLTADQGAAAGGGAPLVGLRAFAEQRRSFLLGYVDKAVGGAGEDGADR